MYITLNIHFQVSSRSSLIHRLFTLKAKKQKQNSYLYTQKTV